MSSKTGTTSTTKTVGIIERMQSGRKSGGFDGGVRSPYWDPVQQHFARLVSNAIKAGSDIES